MCFYWVLWFSLCTKVMFPWGRPALIWGTGAPSVEGFLPGGTLVGGGEDKLVPPLLLCAEAGEGTKPGEKSWPKMQIEDFQSTIFLFLSNISYEMTQLADFEICNSTKEYEWTSYWVRLQNFLCKKIRTMMIGPENSRYLSNLSISWSFSMVSELQKIERHLYFPLYSTMLI